MILQKINSDNFPAIGCFMLFFHNSSFWPKVNVLVMGGQGRERSFSWGDTTPYAAPGFVVAIKGIQPPKSPILLTRGAETPEPLHDTSGLELSESINRYSEICFMWGKGISFVEL